MELIPLMSDSNVLQSIIDGVLEDLQKRLVPISQLREQIQSAPKLRGAYAALNKDGMRLKLSDVANVTYTNEDISSKSRDNGNDSQDLIYQSGTS